MDKSIYLKIQRPSEKCLLCGADLVEARKHPSAIQPEGEDSVLRKDYCPRCWEQLDDEQFFSHWMAKREPRPERTRISREERNRLLLAYFEHLSRVDSSEMEALEREARRFFLAHLLMRFRVFRWKSTDRETGKIVFEHTQTNEEWSVEPLDLPDEMVLRIKQDIEEFLRKGQDLEVSF
ncbi:MAG: hypothetical protein NTW86_16165 [Candidatus Sumerlaeota bacterium]|nr:hypothetical protein [Candidatus Sumerlaeota bacterium]